MEDDYITATATGRATGEGRVVDVCVTFVVQDKDAKKAERMLKTTAAHAVRRAKAAVEKAVSGSRLASSSRTATHTLTPAAVNTSAPAAGRQGDVEVFELRTVESSMRPQYDYEARPPRVVDYRGTVFICVTATTTTAEMVLSTMTEGGGDGSRGSGSGGADEEDVSLPSQVTISAARLSKRQREDLQALAVRDATAQAEKKIAAAIDGLRDGLREGHGESFLKTQSPRRTRTVEAGRITNISIDYLPDGGGGGSSSNGYRPPPSAARALNRGDAPSGMAMEAMAGGGGEGQEGGVIIAHPKRIDVYADVYLTRRITHK